MKSFALRVYNIIGIIMGSIISIQLSYYSICVFRKTITQLLNTRNVNSYTKHQCKIIEILPGQKQQISIFILATVKKLSVNAECLPFEALLIAKVSVLGDL